MAFLCGIAFFLGYTIPNHFHLFEPNLLPLTSWDTAVPFMPWTVFIYTSEYILFVSAYFLFSNEINRNKYIWAYFGVLFTGMLFFVFWPTTYPRGEFPIPPDTHWFTAKVFLTLRTIDNPSNCFPSMHVACCYLTAFAYLPKNESRLKFWIYFIWSTLVGLSTLPTKQHYVVDVVGGILLAVAGYYVFFKKVQYLPAAEYFRRLSFVRRHNQS